MGFGFFLQKGQVTRYDVILGQLLLQDWTVVKVMLTAIATGLAGIYVMRALGWVRFHRKSGSLGGTLVGGLIFGAGFGVLGYCPGTAMGAVGQGSLDALAGVIGILIGCGLYAAVYPKLRDTVLTKGAFGEKTLPELVGLGQTAGAVLAFVIIVAALFALHAAGL
jgi:hypothetical protein